MSSETLSLHTVEASKAHESLKKLLNEVNVKCACGVGVKCFIKEKHLTTPRWYISTGKAIHEPVDRVEFERAAIMLFTKNEYMPAGTSGIIAYNIGDSNLTLVLLWVVPFSEMISDNRFNVRIYQNFNAPVDERLYNEMMESSKKAGEFLEFKELGVGCRATMTKEQKSLLLIEVAQPIREQEESRPIAAEPIKAGKQVEEKLKEWIGGVDSRLVCGMAINNYTEHPMKTPTFYISDGRTIAEPPFEVAPGFAGPSIWAKRDYSLMGTSGVVMYNLTNETRIAVMYSLPLITTLTSQNAFNVRIVPSTAECDSSLFTSMKDSSRYARDGVLKVEDRGYLVDACMGTEEKCVLIVNIKHEHK